MRDIPRHLRSFLSDPTTAAAAVSLFAFAVYLRTLAPGVGFIDGGELATVAATLGIAHPSGYPLFTLLGWVFSHLPVAEEVAVRLNAMAALFSAVGVFVFFHVLRRVLVAGPGKTAGASAVTGAAAAGSIILAFSETYWSQAVSVEVYSLHLLLAGLILLTFLRANSPQADEPRSEGRWYLFAFVVGLSFTNHMTTILLAPGLLTLYFWHQGGGAGAWKRLLRMGGPFALGLSVYAYLPIRASQSPLLNWGNTISAERFWWHITGKQYSVWIFSSFDAAGRQFSYFIRSFPAEFGYIGLPLALVGLVVLWRSHRPLTVGIMLLFTGCLLYAINYDIHDIDSYFLLAYISTALLAGSGFLALFRRIADSGVGRQPIAVAVVVLLASVPLAVHLRSIDESDNHLVDDYTMNMFASLDTGGVILSYQWDYWVSASSYYQVVKGVRPDVTVIDKELLRRSWYIAELGVRVPWLIEASHHEVDAFLEEVTKFERHLPYDGAVIEERYAAMIGSFIGKSIVTRPVYVTWEIEPAYTKGYRRVPSGLAFRLRGGADSTMGPMPDFTYRPFPRRGRAEDMVRRLYADALASRGEYSFFVLKDPLDARKSAEMAVRFDPSSPRVKRLVGILGL